MKNVGAENAGNAGVTKLPAILKEAQALAKESSKSFYDLARALAVLHDADPALLRAVERASGIKRRRLYYLVDVGYMLRSNQIARRDAERLGWTKLQILARHLAATGPVDKAAIAALVRRAAQTTARQLPAALRGLPSSADGRCVQLHLTAQQYRILQAALLSFGAVQKGRGLVGKEEAVVALAQAALGPPSA